MFIRSSKWLNEANQLSFCIIHAYPTKSWQDPASIDIQRSQPIECQFWQDPVRIWQDMHELCKNSITNFRSMMGFQRRVILLAVGLLNVVDGQLNLQPSG